ncbi:hypothetical protein L3X38_023497 [Prunus dulcis]|uniref:Apple domain-containing protein n=1 Tax=Prunus dulcis TaxID=3755 RepID=A0AAD4Z5D4_PRUDU|nr:hypothetical protein L3X38_023497 [Prunus dulcis]
MCLQGFTPRSQEEWEVFNTTSGCMRRTLLVCHGVEGFSQLQGVKLPDMLEFSLNKSMNLEECRVKCLMNCSCTTYANSDISGVASGCIMWFGYLVDITEFIDEDSEQDIYIKLPPSELGVCYTVTCIIVLAAW